MTLLSIIQAIALESLWQEVAGREDLDEWSIISVLSWMQVAATLLVIVLVWIAYVALAMRFRWTPVLTDTALPFVVGISQFVLIELMHPAQLGQWCYALAVVASVGVAIDYRFMRRARRDPRNSEFFDTVQPATWRDFAPQIASVLFLLAAGTAIVLTTFDGWLGIATLVVTVLILTHNVYLQSVYWNRSMGL